MAKKADTKVTKKTTTKTVEELREDLLVAKKSLYDGTLSNPHAIKSIRKDIARALTKANEKKGEK